MRSLLALLLVLALCLTTIALPAIPARADNNGEPDPPSISRFPSFGVPGDTVTVTGANFGPGERVEIYFSMQFTGAEGFVTEHGVFALTFTVPEIHRGPHRVEAMVNGIVVADDWLEVRPALTASPGEGRVGDTFTVTGRGFGREETGIELYFGGQRVAEDVDITADFFGSWTQTATVPPSPKGGHTIDTRPSAHERPTFTVLPGIRIEEPSGSSGQAIGVSGRGFTGGERGISVIFDGEIVPTEPDDVRADGRGSWQASFLVPGLSRGEYTVTARGDRTGEDEVGAHDFEIRAGIMLSHNEGHVGMNVTVTGSGFAIDDEVAVSYEDSGIETASTDGMGSFEVIFAVPRSPAGPREVRARDTEGNEALAVFEMESDPPPVPELVSPAEGGRVGFTGRIRPRFEWSEVEDPSGVYYSVQISVSANRTTDGDFVEPLVYAEGLVGGNFTPDKRLGYGTYYWIVQAVDGAGNESGWTEPQSFGVGRIPLWAFILILLAALLVAGGLFYLFVVRRHLYD